MAVANPTFTDLFRDATKWPDADPDYAVLMNTLGHGVATGGADAVVAFHNTATRSPVAIAVVLEGDEDHVLIGHTPHIYPTDLTSPSPMDGLVTLFVGSDPDTCTTLVLPQVAFGRSNQCRSHDIATIVGPGGHGAAPPVYRDGPHAAPVVQIQVRRVHLLPPTAAADAIDRHDDGRYTLADFYAQFVQGKHDSADAAEAALWAPTALWFRAASTNVAGDQSVVRVAPIAITLNHIMTRLNAFMVRRKKELMSRVGVGGPQLSNNTFAAGIQDLSQVLTRNHEDALAYDRSARLKTFADKHGTALEQRMLNLTGAADGDHLPPVHKLLVNAPRGKEHSILGSHFAERAAATDLPIGISNAPLSTPTLMDVVFKNYNPYNNGLTLGQGLTPFAIICEGHADVEAIKTLVKRSEIVAQGNSLTLSDAEALTTSDVRLPTEVFIAKEKLFGWSVVVDVFHGERTPIAVSIRDAVREVTPYLDRLVKQSSEATDVGMELVCRVLYEFQQDYFTYCRKLAGGTHLPAPDFARIISQVESFRAQSLSPLPNQWYANFQGAPQGPSRNPTETGGGGGGTLRQATGTVPQTNARADEGLLRRFRECGHQSIKSMIGDHAVEVPKINGKEICLSWALRGSCSGNCKRKDQHKNYSRDVVQKIHALMDACSVAHPTN